MSGSTWVDLMLHPVRLRIVGEFSGRERSPGQLAAALPDVPHSSLYRHIAQLVGGGVLEVVAERPTGGPAERVYRVAAGADRLPAEHLDGLSADEQRRYFSVFVASLLDSLSAYAASPGARPSADGLSYNRAVVHLSDEERAQFSARLAEVVGDMLALAPAAHRRPFHIASSVIPGPRS
ncbi:helix-turn-helix domain-containing protein [Pseudonocardia humida]|uniref:Helix-turn-helix domain-containing protein n=1 Tax=Pseudonocardia humida TaxID=2800819 RepID=A0ABT1A4I2_9PSEU|nr:helix-turn-helix domain-containing protein [Pseudonocardia humida]MCO1657911.1 helix-turn-helix domain-containing protein [Pseudonocardia humida]